MPSYTNPSVATLIRTEGGKTDLKATKQANKVDPVVKTSSTRSMWRKGVGSAGGFAGMANAPETFALFSAMLSLV